VRTPDVAHRGQKKMRTGKIHTHPFIYRRACMCVCAHEHLYLYLYTVYECLVEEGRGWTSESEHIMEILACLLFDFNRFTIGSDGGGGEGLHSRSRVGEGP
jgi:hypothetical protein